MMYYNEASSSNAYTQAPSPVQSRTIKQQTERLCSRGAVDASIEQTGQFAGLGARSKASPSLTMNAYRR